MGLEGFLGVVEFQIVFSTSLRIPNQLRQNTVFRRVAPEHTYNQAADISESDCQIDMHASSQARWLTFQKSL
jgi:hypothetical protein